MPTDPETLSILQGLPVGIAIVILLQGPWITAMLMGWIGRTKKVNEAADKLITAANAERDRAREDAAKWQQAWKEEQARGDTATATLGNVSVELGQVTAKIVSTFSTNDPQKGDNGSVHPPLAVGDGK